MITHQTNRTKNQVAIEPDQTDPGKILNSISRLREACRKVITMVNRSESMVPTEKFLAAVLREEAARLDPTSK